MSAEPVSIAKPFLRVAPFLVGERNTTIFLSFYSYARHIDDAVDSGQNPKKMKLILRSDMNVLLQLVQGKPVNLLQAQTDSDRINKSDFDYRRSLLQTGFEALPAETRTNVAFRIYQSLQGAFLDNIAITYGRPVFDHLRKARDYRMVMVYFEALSEVFFNKPFVEKLFESDLEKFFQWVLRFDALDDIITDLEAGICVFSRESLAESGVTLTRGKEVGPEIVDFYRKQRDILVLESKTILPLIYKSNLPMAAKLALHARLLRQAYRISKSDYRIGKTVIFGRNFSK